MSNMATKPHTVKWNDHTREQRRVRPANVLEDGVRQIEDRELVVGWCLQ
jgi:hypothetical protein